MYNEIKKKTHSVQSVCVFFGGWVKWWEFWWPHLAITWLKQCSAWTRRPKCLRHRPFSSWITHWSSRWYSVGSECGMTSWYIHSCAQKCVGQKVLKEILLGSFLSCSSASSNMAKMFWVKLGLLPTTVKPFQTYIISWRDGGQMFDVGADHPEDENEWEWLFSPEQGQVVWQGWENCNAVPFLPQTSL